MEVLVWLLALFWGHPRTCRIFTSTRSPSQAKSRGEHCLFWLWPYFSVSQVRGGLSGNPATDSSSRCHCPLPAVHSNRYGSDYSHQQDCSRERGRGMLRRREEHGWYRYDSTQWGARHGDTPAAWSKPGPLVSAPLWPQTWQIRAGGCRATGGSEGKGVRRQEVGRWRQGKEQEPAPATEKGDTTFPAPTPISEYQKLPWILSMWGETGRKL